MKRTTIFIPETLERDLQLYAKRWSRPVASVVREAVEQYLAAAEPTGRVPSFAATGASGRRDTAERHESLLFKGLSPHGAAMRRPAASAQTRRRRK